MNRPFYNKIASAFIAGAIVFLLPSCGEGASGNEDSLKADSAQTTDSDAIGGVVDEIESAEAVTADVTAEQMEETPLTDDVEAARIAARNAVKPFLRVRITDTLELQRELKEAYDYRHRYEKAGLKECAEAYDSAFRSTLRAVRPDIRRHLR